MGRSDSQLGEAFAAIRGYSPYDNVRPQPYPAILALAGLTDPRVTYWEPAKWVAKLRATMTGGGPVLLRTAMEAGHGGASGRFERLDDVAARLRLRHRLRRRQDRRAGGGRRKRRRRPHRWSEVRQPILVMAGLDPAIQVATLD